MLGEPFAMVNPTVLGAAAGVQGSWTCCATTWGPAKFATAGVPVKGRLQLAATTPLTTSS
jgi:hypothetical protein